MNSQTIFDAGLEAGLDASLHMAGEVARYWGNQIGGTFLASGSALSLGSLVCTVLIAAYLAVPRGRREMPRLAVWRRALFPRRLLRSASGRADLGYFAFSLLGSGLVLGWALLSGAAIARGVAGGLDGVFGTGVLLPLPPIAATALLTLIMFIAYEFAYWLDHYCSHKIPLLWHFHRVHHAAESLSLLTNFRVHPVDTIVFVNIVAIVLGLVAGVLDHLLGPVAQPLSIGSNNVLVFVGAVLLTHLQHSHLWITFGPRWGRRLLSPAHHQVHHSADPQHFDRNFGNTLALFDRIFGTLHVPSARREVARFGLDGAVTNPHGWHAALITPFSGAGALLWSMRRRRMRGPIVPAE